MQKNNILIIIAILIVAIGGGIWYFDQHQSNPPGGVACTQEAMQCPDGSYVGRTGPDCAFALCHAASSTVPASSSTSTGADGSGKFCGGIAAFPCPVGYSCKLDGNFPDAGGHCVKN
jgi:hypothetical protein